MFPLQSTPILKSYSQYSDLPDNGTIQSYSLDEIMTEKVVALLDPARNEPRDLYDIWYFLEEKHVNLDQLLHAINEKLEFRGKQFDEIKGNLDQKEARYKKL